MFLVSLFVLYIMTSIHFECFLNEKDRVEGSRLLVVGWVYLDAFTPGKNESHHSSTGCVQFFNKITCDVCGYF